MEHLVVIHLVTTGRNEREDGIVAATAVRLVAGMVRDRFRALAHPAQEVSPQVLQQAGLEPEDLAAAGDERLAAGRLLEFVGGQLVVAHEADLLARFIQVRAGLRIAGPILDVRELARFVIPTAPGFDLHVLLQFCGIKGHNAEAVARLWLQLVRRTGDLPLAVLTAVTKLLESSGHPLSAVFAAAQRARLKHALATGEKRHLADLMPEFHDILGRHPTDNHRTIPTPLNPDAVREIFAPGGPLAKCLPAYEERPEQVRMAQAVCEAFNTGAILLCEAGTGTGKSLAYLVPAVLWARRNRQQVVISTNTKNLQEQLFSKDLPLLQRALGGNFRCALLKGRSNYLCVRKFLHLLENAERELEVEERAALPPLITWAVATESGDIAENTGFFSSFSPELWAKISASAEECVGRRCSCATRCFLRRARALAQQADIIVANHAVVFSELPLDNSILPAYEHIVFDEAHHLEDAATEHLGVRVSAIDFARVLNRLYHRRSQAATTGLLANILPQISRALPPRHKRTFQTTTTVQHIQNLLAEFPRVTQTINEFFNSLAILFLETPSEADKVRYRSNALPDCWPTILTSGEHLLENLRGVALNLDNLSKELEQAVCDLPWAHDWAQALSAEATSIRLLVNNLSFLLRADSPNHVYWAERTNTGQVPYALAAAPLDIGALMAERVYRQKSTIIFSSATLSVRGQFDFMRARLGLHAVEASRIQELDVGSSFDFARQVLFAVPTFLPTPDVASRAFAEEFTTMAIALLRASQGRGLVLFTSHRMLSQAQLPIRQSLARNGIRVLAQGIDGERSQITTMFARDIHSVLLGTQSFWEGVDVVGESLSCLILAKLPFQVFTEPIVEARCEQLRALGSDPFLDYSLPSAVIRLKQGFGRLIRARTDRGVVIVADPRLASRSYRRAFLESLPTRARFYGDITTLVQDVRDFLKAN